MATDFIFADDSRCSDSERDGMGPLVAIGGIHVPSENVGSLEKALKDICDEAGFPTAEQFKWSPGKKEKHLKQNLTGESRSLFFERVLHEAKAHNATATVVIEDSNYNTARLSSADHEQDCTSLFLERADWTFRRDGRFGVVVVAKPSGGPRDDNSFLLHCLEVLQEGTEYMTLESLALPVVTVPSRHARTLQLADLVTSCTVARVRGESRYSPRIFEGIRPLLRSDGSRLGGVGLKLHPDLKYANLYHWLLGDTHWHKGGQTCALPCSEMPFPTDPELEGE